MRFDRSLRQKLAVATNEHIERIDKVLAESDKNFIFLEKARRNLSDHIGQELTVEQFMANVTGEMIEFKIAYGLLLHAQTIVFSKEQAEVFADAPKKYFGGLDFTLPFETVFLQFNQPLTVMCNGQPDTLLGVALFQVPVNETLQTVHDALLLSKLGRTDFGRDIRKMIGRYFPARDEKALHTLMAPIYEDGNQRVISFSSERDTFFGEELDIDKRAVREWHYIKNICVACIGFINSENVNLVRYGETDPKINSKREKKGKTVLTPYYLCHIRGVTYTKEGEPVEKHESGRHVSFRFDVRGFFRRLPNGKTIWVRPHQRGLAHEKFIPKVYALKE